MTIYKQSMKDPKAKDLILQYLFKKGTLGATSKEIADDLGLPHSTVFTLCKSLDNEGHAFTNEIRHDGRKVEGFYPLMAVISHAGIHFAMNKSYVKKARLEWWINVPKSMWLVVALFSVIAFALPLYLQYFNKEAPSKKSNDISTPVQEDSARFADSVD